MLRKSVHIESEGERDGVKPALKDEGDKISNGSGGEQEKPHSEGLMGTSRRSRWDFIASCGTACDSVC